MLGILDRLEDVDLEALGYPRSEILADLDEAAKSGEKHPKNSLLVQTVFLHQKLKQKVNAKSWNMLFQS